MGYDSYGRGDLYGQNSGSSSSDDSSDSGWQWDDALRQEGKDLISAGAQITAAAGVVALADGPLPAADIVAAPVAAMGLGTIVAGAASYVTGGVGGIAEWLID